MRRYISYLYYKYLHSYPYMRELYFHLQHSHKFHWEYHNSLFISQKEFHVLIMLPLRIWIIFFPQILNFHLIQRFLHKTLNACKILSLLVHHSRFLQVLFQGFQSIWLICGLHSGLSMKEIATSLCTKQLFHPINHTFLYQRQLSNIFKILHFRLHFLLE